MTLVFLVWGSIVYAADFTSSAGGGDWDDTNSWNEAGFPVDGDNVTITSTINVNVASACTNLTINTGGILRHTADVTLTVSNDLTLSGTGQITPDVESTSRILDVDNNFDVSAASTSSVGGIRLNVSGTTMLNGQLTFTSNTGIKFFDGAVTVNSTGSWISTTATGNNIVRFRNGLTNDGSFSAGSILFNSNAQSIGGTESISVANNLTVNTITVTNNLVSPDELTVGADIRGTGRFNQGVNAILNVGDDVEITTFDPSANPNTVVYNTSISSNIGCPLSAYHHLTLNKSGTSNSTMQCSTTINGDLTITSGTLRSDDNATTLTHSVAGTTTISTGTVTGSYNIRENNSVLNTLNLTMSGGTITGGNSSSTVNVTGLFNTSGTGSQINACVFTVSGASTIDGGFTFGSNTGVKTFQSLVTIGASGTWVSTTVTGNNRLVFQNGLTNNGSFSAGALQFNTNDQSISGSSAVSFSGRVTVGNSRTLTNNNTVNITSEATESLRGNGTWTQGSGSTLNFSGETSSLNNLNFSTSTNTVNYNRAGIQTIYVPSDGSYSNLTISGSGTKTLNGTIDVDNTLDMTSGEVDLATFTLTLGTAASTPGTLSYTTGDLYNGSFTRWFNAVTLSAGNVAGLFPMADTDGNSRPFYVTPATAPGTGGTISVSITTNDQATDIGPIDDNGTDIVRQHQASWNVSTGNGLAGGDNYNIRGSGTGFGRIDAVSDLRLMTSGGVVGNDGGAGGSTSDPVVDRDALLLSELTNSFHIGSTNATDSPLPIKLFSFDVKMNFDVVEIHWLTSAETNNDYFTIERSSNGSDFHELSRIDGAGNSTEKLNYSFTDFNPLNGDSYYRLRQTDFDGKTEVFAPVKIQGPVKNNISIYPNPLTGPTFNIQLDKLDDQVSTIFIYDYVGKLVSFQSIEKEQSIIISFTERIKPGLYIVSIQNGTINSNQQLIVR
ncbi:T9SS type A sorting domain-containing protein [Reichenbachiella sp.]|uniref:T9SS type A sorting domain-containing protein n=1 Tax=Reichenbachiella sp. TaxID=2184521 RepID=UPI003BAFB47B